MKTLLIIMALMSSVTYAKGGGGGGHAAGHASGHGHSSHVAMASHPSVINVPHSATSSADDEAKRKAKNADGVALALGGSITLYILYSMLAGIFD
jgi:hypothetical protein